VLQFRLATEAQPRPKRCAVALPPAADRRAQMRPRTQAP